MSSSVEPTENVTSVENLLGGFCAALFSPHSVFPSPVWKMRALGIVQPHTSNSQSSGTPCTGFTSAPYPSSKPHAACFVTDTPKCAHAGGVRALLRVGPHPQGTR